MTKRKQIELMTPEHATNLAILGLQHLAGDDELLARFLALTGIEVENLRQVADSEAFLSAVLEFFMNDEPSLLAFAASQGINPADISGAKFTLEPGNSAEDWP